MAVCGNVRPENLVPGADLFDEQGVKLPLPCPLSRHALRPHGPRPFNWMSRLSIPHYLVVVRHVHQALASRIQRAQTEDRLAYPRVWNAEMERLLDVWVQHVDLLIEEPTGVTGIDFDRWLVDRQYRLEIGQKLGALRPGDRPQKRGTGGDGSSFEGLSQVQDPYGLLARSAQLTGPAHELWERCVAQPSVIQAVARLEQAQPINF